MYRYIRPIYKYKKIDSIKRVKQMLYRIEMDTNNNDSNNDKFNNDDLKKENDKYYVINNLKNIDWQRFHNLCSSIGKDLNAPQWRFLKAIFLENAIAAYSNNVLVYVGDKEEGCDFVIKDKDINIKIEMKYVEGGIFNGKKMTLKKDTSEIKLMNSNGTNTHTSLPETYSDYLLIVDLNGAALISKEELIPYLKIGGDGIKAKIPTEKLHIIFEPKDILPIIKKTDLQIRTKIMDTIDKIINDV